MWYLHVIALFRGHSPILSHSHGEKAWYYYYVTNWKWWTQFRNDANVPTLYTSSTASDIDVLPTALNFASTKSPTMCIDINLWKAFCMFVDWKGLWNDQAEAKHVAPCQKKCLHLNWATIIALNQFTISGSWHSSGTRPSFSSTIGHCIATCLIVTGDRLNECIWYCHQKPLFILVQLLSG